MTVILLFNRIQLMYGIIKDIQTQKPDFSFLIDNSVKKISYGQKT